MLFAKRLREGVRRGEITCSVRIWIRPRVTSGKRYRVGEGEIEVDSIEPIEASAVAHRSHLSIEVRKKRFGYFLDDHHGDGRVALNCKASADLRDMLQQRAPGQFHIPKYLGSRGWIGLWLDGANVDWPVVELALREAYLLVAPKTLASAR